jgi:hypothetical protein
MAIHVARVGLFPVAANGNILTGTYTIKEKITSTSEHRVIPDSSIASSAGYPAVENYLVAENAAGYSLDAMNQTMIVTSTDQSGVTEVAASTSATVSVNAAATTTIVSGVVGQQIWVYGWLITISANGTGQWLSAATAMTAAFAMAANGGSAIMAPDANIPIFKCATGDTLRLAAVGGNVTGVVTYSLVTP